ncbi:hypothetical protein K470DRAFT_257449 [Piedraia hortae CBS 480.64]|uniref:Uncharacterized protein n=1 Tax=Piedraia hortae CBS 480.64 TaxID=1314780 RepID=A0A6A7C068_9PEZI|nr:hypothetical protein K470DRAFT_257449 [Piedraia hortae CBS 480.64]
MLSALVAGTFAENGKRSSPLCDGKSYGLRVPYDGAILKQNTTNGMCNEFDMVYCSSQGGNTETLFVDIWMSEHKNGSCAITGQVITRDARPDDNGNGNSYTFKAKVCPSADGYPKGDRVITAYEIHTGWQNPNGVLLSRIDVNMETF